MIPLKRDNNTMQQFIKHHLPAEYTLHYINDQYGSWINCKYSPPFKSH